MIVNVTQRNILLGEKKEIKIQLLTARGFQGAKGADGKNAYPDDGNIGALLEKQTNGVGWTNQPKNISLNGGNF